jgi:hypothetical protein
MGNFLRAKGEIAPPQGFSRGWESSKIEAYIPFWAKQYPRYDPAGPPPTIATFSNIF